MPEKEGEVFIERRKYKRVDKKLKVTYKVISTQEEVEKIKEELRKKTTETSNISIGGIQLIDDIPLRPEQILRIEFKIENREEPVTTFAEVRWSAKDENIGKYRTGIEFLVLKDEDKRLIEKLVEGE